jgi:hypothetical protein
MNVAMLDPRYSLRDTPSQVGSRVRIAGYGEAPAPIIFSEWALPDGNMAKRRDFLFAELGEEA